VLSVAGMVLFWRKAAIGVALLLLLPALSAAQRVVAPVTTSTDPPPAKTAQSKEHKHGAIKPTAPTAAELPTTLPAPRPPTPEQMPASPPQVTYHDGLLSIVANNSTLSDILREVGVSTGATVDAPANLTRERVAVRIGPGPPRDVLSDLLTGGRLDYILVGGDGDPNSVTSIILSANQGSPSGATPPPAARPGTPPPPEPEEEADDEPTPEPPAPAQPPQRPPTQGQRSFTPQQPPDQVSGQPAGSGEGGQPIRTPEQMLEQLRRMQQPNAQTNTQQNPPQ
jgi:hypothetical protein